MTQVPTRERLLDAAGDLFYKHGFQAVGLDQILDTVGITKTAFYKHFASKDDLIVAILDHRDQREMEEWMAYIRIRGRDDARRQLEALFELLDDWFKNPEFRGCLFLNALTEFPSENDPINRAARKHGEHLAAAVMELASHAGAAEPGALTEQLMLLVTGAIASRHRGGDLDAAKTAEAMAKVLISSACGPAARRR
ncbi:MAG: TetR/AcrR family transcriptional regulator [Phycisphaeraceae bacterium]|nr:TetR/AcrR family transcriptional regulator [Phycisphaeraceae bacterium]MBX3360416.1 TetR/AcrR family transcriptional regulator [Phycisphaeraceae bacterium]MCW5768551.1 TetR/AcrR family transcriptional regulator [Phycisphaeraceae bacterium]